MSELAKGFEAELLARLDRAQQLTGYSFKGIRDLIAAKGAVGTALYLLDLSNLGTQPEGFRALIKSDLLDCSLEQVVLDWADRGLFPAGIIASAKARLILARGKIARQKSVFSDRSDS